MPRNLGREKGPCPSVPAPGKQAGNMFWQDNTAGLMARVVTWVDIAGGCGCGRALGTCLACLRVPAAIDAWLHCPSCLTRVLWLCGWEKKRTDDMATKRPDWARKLIATYSINQASSPQGLFYRNMTISYHQKFPSTFSFCSLFSLLLLFRVGMVKTGDRNGDKSSKV